MASGVCYSSDYDMEYRHDADDAWYTVKVVVGDGGETLKVKYEGFLESSDVTFRADAFAQVEEIDKLVNRFRPLSQQVQDKECHTIIEGMTVCASYSFGQDELRFYDAVVEAVHHEKHSFASDEEECGCSFVLAWQHGPNSGTLTMAGIANICLLQQNTKVDPGILHFSLVAREIVEGKLDKFSQIANHGVQVMDMETTSKFYGKKSHSVQLCCEDLGADCIHRNEFVDADVHHFLLIENLEKDLSATIIREFIYKKTSIRSHAYVFPCRSSESFARGVIVVKGKRETEHICRMINNPNQFVVSAKGRPWVITENVSSGPFESTQDSLIYSEDLCKKDVDKELKVVHLGTEAFRKAKQLKSLFLEFEQHGQRLSRKFATDVTRILELST